MLEEVNCDLCGANDTELVFEEQDRLHHLDGTFHLVRCRQCGLMYLTPRPTMEEMARYYPSDYHPYSTLDDHPSVLVRLDHRYGVSKRCRAVIARSDVKEGRVLDIGCSTGSFLNAMRQRGNWEPYGVEINAEAANYARERLGLNVFAGTLTDAHYPDSFFDIITLWNVLEHLHQPRATLIEIARIIRPGGLLTISLPNPDCIEASFFERYWAGLDAPRHLYIFSRRTLEKMLALTGFEVEEITSFTGRHHVLALSLGFWLDEKVGSDRRRYWLKRAMGSLPLRLLTLPYYAIADRWNQSSVMTVFAQCRQKL
ncbi:MAG: class I SAM-dependent methyltransferase [Anaerolineae bacterium]